MWILFRLLSSRVPRAAGRSRAGRSGSGSGSALFYSILLIFCCIYSEPLHLPFFLGLGFSVLSLLFFSWGGMGTDGTDNRCGWGVLSI